MSGAPEHLQLPHTVRPDTVRPDTVLVDTVLVDTVSPPRFDLCGPLPRGLTVLEASAGTGKTFTIAALAARYLAAGTPIDRLLVVSFTRAATGELRDRVRTRLVDAERALAAITAGSEPAAADPLVMTDPLVTTMAGDDPERARRRLARALAEFDAATITTTHGFCQYVLDSLGTAGDIERDGVFVEDSGDLVAEVVDDLYVRRFAAPGPVEFSATEARRIARKVVDNPGTDVSPADAPPGSAADLRYRLVNRTRDEVELRKLRAGTLSYDDLLTRLRDTLADPERATAAVRRLRSQFAVVLVDEFQDTDPVQWEILQRAFGDGTPTLVLIGDPKQAIYSFRGADVHAYLHASSGASARATLGVNWRSDAGLLRAFDALFGDALLGHPGIPYRHVDAADENRRPGVQGLAVPEPLRVRVLHRGDRRVDVTPTGFARKPLARALIAEDLAADVVALLSAGAQLLRSDIGETGPRPLTPGDVAVLVFTHREAAVIQEALAMVQVPAVISGGGSVFATEIAAQWLRLLRALERPESSGRARDSALTWFVGWDTARVAAADDQEIGALQARLHHWAAVLAERGVAALLELVTVTESLPARMLAHHGGERRLTDLRHVGQLLHAEATQAQLGPTALTGWLRRRIAGAGDDGASEERSRRLESDAQAVQVMTVHRSKGLEWPVVYLPYLWGKGPDEREPIPVYHDPATGRRTVDVGGRGGPSAPTHMDLYEAERRGEDLRLAYVALTRARHQAVVWWAGAYDSKESSLLRLLLTDRPGGVVPEKVRKLPSDDEVLRRLEAIASSAAGSISVERCGPVPRRVWPAGGPTAEELAVRPFDRPVDTDWRRSSYTGITAALHDPTVRTAPAAGRGPAVGSEAEVVELADEALAPTPSRAGGADDGTEPDPGGPVAADADRLRSVSAPMADLPAGAAFGTLVHAVLEATDFTAPDLRAELSQRVRTAIARGGPVELVERDLVDGIAAAIETPLGPLVAGRRLRDLAVRDRLDELGFELPLVGGDTPRAELTVTGIAERLAGQLPADDLLAAYPAMLADPALAGVLRGYLTGSIDLVLRVRGDTPAAPGLSSAGRFVVVDYKTNRLAPAGTPLTAWHYRPQAMADAMLDAHYPLQALLYLVALHRYLRWRLVGYDPQEHLGGVLYLFVRGMSGPETPVVGAEPCGVFGWQPPPAVVVALSDLFDLGTG